MNRPGREGTEGRGNGSNQDLRALLANYVRYAALIRFQEEALEAEDLDRFQDLARAREAIQEDVGETAPALPAPETLDPEIRHYFERVYQSVREALFKDRQLQARLQRMKKDTSGELNSLNGRDGKVKGYLERDERKAPGRAGRLNIRL